MLLFELINIFLISLFSFFCEFLFSLFNLLNTIFKSIVTAVKDECFDIKYNFKENGIIYTLKNILLHIIMVIASVVFLVFIICIAFIPFEFMNDNYPLLYYGVRWEDNFDRFELIVAIDIILIIFCSLCFYQYNDSKNVLKKVLLLKKSIFKMLLKTHYINKVCIKLFITVIYVITTLLLITSVVYIRKALFLLGIKLFNI